MRNVYTLPNGIRVVGSPRLPIIKRNIEKFVVGHADDDSVSIRWQRYRVIEYKDMITGKIDYGKRRIAA